MHNQTAVTGFHSCGKRDQPHKNVRSKKKELPWFPAKVEVEKSTQGTQTDDDFILISSDDPRAKYFLDSKINLEEAIPFDFENEVFNLKEDHDFVLVPDSFVAQCPSVDPKNQLTLLHRAESLALKAAWKGGTFFLHQVVWKGTKFLVCRVLVDGAVFCVCKAVSAAVTTSVSSAVFVLLAREALKIAARQLV